MLDFFQFCMTRRAAKQRERDFIIIAPARPSQLNLPRSLALKVRHLHNNPAGLGSSSSRYRPRNILALSFSDTGCRIYSPSALFKCDFRARSRSRRWASSAPRPRGSL